MIFASLALFASGLLDPTPDFSGGDWRLVTRGSIDMSDGSPLNHNVTFMDRGYSFIRVGDAVRFEAITVYLRPMPGNHSVEWEEFVVDCGVVQINSRGPWSQSRRVWVPMITLGRRPGAVPPDSRDGHLIRAACVTKEALGDGVTNPIPRARQLLNSASRRPAN